MSIKFFWESGAHISTENPDFEADFRLLVSTFGPPDEVRIPGVAAPDTKYLIKDTMYTLED